MNEMKIDSRIPVYIPIYNRLAVIVIILAYVHHINRHM